MYVFVCVCVCVNTELACEILADGQVAVHNAY